MVFVAPGARDGALAENVVHFARVLRGCGIPIGSGQIIDALRALDCVDITRRDEFCAALRAMLITDHRHRALFDEAFGLFWRNPHGIDQVLASLLPAARVPHETRGRGISRRVADALGRNQSRPPATQDRAIEFDAAMTWSDVEAIRQRDFAEMSADELRHARRLIARMTLPIADVATRRYRPDPRGSRVDLRATMRASLRTGASAIPLRWRSRQTRPPPLVILCDISGSMERYAEMLLYFIHTLASARDRVSTFVFGTALTNITRHLRHRDVDLALARVGEAVTDWSGGTRIGECLRRFHHTWSRRVLGQGAVVLLITDGLDRDGGQGLDDVMTRLGRSCRKLIWLNPLLRYAGFEPRAAGIRAMLPHVDEFRPVHNLASLSELARALDTRPARVRRRP